VAKPGRDKATLASFFDQLGPERSALITHVSADGAEWISTVVAKQCPQAVRCGRSVPCRAVGHRSLGRGPSAGMESRPRRTTLPSPESRTLHLRLIGELELQPATDLLRGVLLGQVRLHDPTQHQIGVQLRRLRPRRPLGSCRRGPGQWRSPLAAPTSSTDPSGSDRAAAGHHHRRPTTGRPSGDTFPPQLPRR